MVVHSFSAARGARVFVPPQFPARLLDMLHDFDEAREDVAQFQQALADIESRLGKKPEPVTPPRTAQELAEYEKTARVVTKRDVEEEVISTYWKFMEAADNSVMFIAFCMKNQAFMNHAAKKIEEDANRQLGLKVITFADPRHLVREMDDLRSEILEAGQVTSNLLTRATKRALLKNDNPNNDTVFIDLANNGSSTFGDWVEEGFMFEFGLPLNVFSRSPWLSRQIKAELTSDAYCENLMQRIREGRLHQEFPGLSLDGQAPQPSQLDEVYKLIFEHAATFTPSPTPQVIHLADAAKGTQGAGRRARGPLKHGAAGRAPG